MRDFLIRGPVALFIRRGIIAVGTAWALLMFAPLSLIPFGWPPAAAAQTPPVPTTARGTLFQSLQEKWPDIQFSGGDTAFVPETGQNLAWDSDKQAWVDVKTGQSVVGKFNTLRGASFKYCLQRKWPDIRFSGGDTAFVPETGQNLAWDSDKQAWIDVKTLKAICPSVLQTVKRVVPPPAKPQVGTRTTEPKTNVGSGGSQGCADIRDQKTALAMGCIPDSPSDAKGAVSNSAAGPRTLAPVDAKALTAEEKALIEQCSQEGPYILSLRGTDTLQRCPDYLTTLNPRGEGAGAPPLVGNDTAPKTATPASPTLPRPASGPRPPGRICADDQRDGEVNRCNIMTLPSPGGIPGYPGTIPYGVPGASGPGAPYGGR